MLTHAAYAAIGGVKGAIATRAEAELERLTPEQREALKRVMIRLVTPGEGQADTRRLFPRSQLLGLRVDRAAMERAIADIASRLLANQVCLQRTQRTVRPAAPSTDGST